MENSSKRVKLKIVMENAKYKRTEQSVLVNGLEAQTVKSSRKIINQEKSAITLETLETSYHPNRSE